MSLVISLVIVTGAVAGAVAGDLVSYHSQGIGENGWQTLLCVCS